MANAQKNIAFSLGILAKYGRVNKAEVTQIKNIIQYTTSLEEAGHEVAFVQENGPENYAVKMAIFDHAQKYASIGWILPVRR